MHKYMNGQVTHWMDGTVADGDTIVAGLSGHLIFGSS